LAIICYFIFKELELKIKLSTILFSLLVSAPIMAQDTNTTHPKETNLSKVESKQSDRVLAIVNGVKIMESNFLEDFKDQSLANQKILLDGVIASELITQYAQKQTAYNDKEILDQLKKAEGYHKAANRRFNDFDKRLVHGLLAIRHLAKHSVVERLNPKAIQSYYDDNKERFKNLVHVDAYRVSVDSKETTDKIIEKLSKTKKENLTELFKKLPQEFMGVELKSYPNYYQFGRGATAFNNSIFRLESGEYTKEPLFDGRTYYILYCEQKVKEDKIAPFEDIKKNLEIILPKKFSKEWIDTKVEKLYKDANITNNLK